MHPYATDSNERYTVLSLIGLISVALGWLLSIAPDPVRSSIPWFVDAPSVMGFFGLLYLLFNRVLWRWSFLRSVGLVRVPDLSGTWKGHLYSSYNNTQQKYDATLTIKQNWVDICILLETSNSSSRSVLGGIITNQAGGSTLGYQYINQPKAHSKNTMHAHKGTAELTLSADGHCLEGDYYTGRDRVNFGSLHFEKIELGGKGVRI